MSFDLKEFKRLAEKRTSGPWHVGHINENLDRAEIENHEGIVITSDCKRSDESFLCYCGTHADAIIERIEKLEKALKFYADVENWNEWDMELGEIARKALEERGE